MVVYSLGCCIYLVVMRRKGEKVVLKSEVFKVKTPDKVVNNHSRSPISRSPYLSKKEKEKEDERVDPNDLFQKVCCPNCRFIFKIIKNAESQVSFSPRRKERPANAATQTEEKMMRDIGELRNLSLDIPKRLSPKDDSLLRSNHFKSEMSQIAELPSESFKEDSFKQLDLSNNFKLLQSAQQPPASQHSRPSHKSSIRLGDKHPSQASFIESGKGQALDKQKNQLSEKEREQLKEVLWRLYVSSKRNEILEGLLNELPSSFEVPAYHKMLLDGEAK